MVQRVVRMGLAGAFLSLAAPTFAQIQTVDPNAVIDADLDGGQ